MLIRCTLCRGAKEVYQLNGAYTSNKFLGGKSVKCPECGGIGKVLDEAEKARIKEESKENKSTSKKSKSKNVA